MAKKNTKAAREAEQKARLKQRLTDLAMGAYGGYTPPDLSGDEFVGMVGAIGLDAFGRWLGAIRNTFCDADRNSHIIADFNLEQFDDLDKATEHLWSNGIRP